VEGAEASLESDARARKGGAEQTSLQHAEDQKEPAEETFVSKAETKADERRTPQVNGEVGDVVPSGARREDVDATAADSKHELVASSEPQSTADSEQHTTQAQASEPNPEDPSGAPLPDGWTAHLHDGSTYYFNSATGCSQWNRPDAPEPLRDGWETFFDEASKQSYYFNRTTGESSWDRPV
jgi:hypothetical protein